MNPQSASGNSGRNPQSLRNRLFISSALLTTVLLGIAAWVINTQVVRQARQQVQAEVETLLPLYDAVWNEQARRLATMGAAMADSPIVKTVFGDAGASRNQQTLHEMVVDTSTETILPGDLILMCDGAGQIFFAEQQGGTAPEVNRLEAARLVGESQSASRSFIMLGGRLFQMALSPVVLHSGSADFDNTLAVIGTGTEINNQVAAGIKQRIHSDVVFLLDGKVYASSLAAGAEQAALKAILTSGINTANAERSTEITIGEDVYLAFARQLTDFDEKQIGQVVVLRSLAGAGQLFRAISNRLVVLWTLAIAAAWLLSYLIAGRITRPLELLANSVKELGQGNYAAAVPTRAQGEVAQLAQAFDQMRQSLRQSQAALLKNERLATIGQMASSIIHDLRNPLATISTAAEVMSNDGLGHDRRRRLIETQLRASHRMSSMLVEILEFSRGSYKLDKWRQPLAATVEHFTQELAAQMSQLGIRFKNEIPEDILIEADDEKLGRVFVNLLTNSIQAIQQDEASGRTIEFRAMAESGVVRIDVTDDGPGIPAAVRDRLFEPFISQGKPGGTGLGLAIARGIIEAHGGRISLANSETGAHFVILLPQGSVAETAVVGQ